MFLLAAMTYVEGSSLHQDRGGSTIFARYAFNELWSFIAGWAVLLDYVILIAATVFSATNYLGVWRLRSTSCYKSCSSVNQSWTANLIPTTCDNCSNESAFGAAWNLSDLKMCAVIFVKGSK